MATEYKETLRQKGMLFTKEVKEVPAEKTLSVKKGLARKAVTEQVFDYGDAIADNAKMISLLMSTVKRIYEALPDDTKDNIADKEMIESMINIFDNTQTLADVQYAKEGDEMVKRIFNRQAQVGNIVKGIIKG